MPTVYPVPGRYLNDVPAVEHECEDDLCVESGAFALDPPPIEPAIDHPPKAPETPGPSDSPED